MEHQEHDLSSNEARNVIAELDAAAIMTEQALSDGPASVVSAADEHVLGAVSAANVDLLRNKARRQREKGIENLARRHDGVASVVARVQLRERVVASAFERYFATIETGIHVINKSGAMFVGDVQAAKLMQTIVDRVTAMEERIAGEIKRINVSLEVHSTREDFIKPSYTRPAADHEVQMRTRLANRVMAVFRKQDDFVVSLNQLLWNDEAEPNAIELEEFAIKKEMRSLAQFIGRTLRGMRTKVTPKDVAPAEAAAPVSENAGALAEQPLAA